MTTASPTTQDSAAPQAGLIIEQRVWTAEAGWVPSRPSVASADLVLVFGSGEALRTKEFGRLSTTYPGSVVVGCSTAGEIVGTKVMEGSLATTAIKFRHTKVRASWIDLSPAEASRDAGRRLIGGLPQAGLRHVLVLSDGLRVNGTELVEGMRSALPAGVQVTGGLAGDGARFEHTFILVDGEAREGRLVAVGLYGERIRIGYGSLGGWDAFGPLRRVTRSVGNVLYELDGRPALSLYKDYLGPHAAGLPATGLLFPLSIQLPDDERGASPRPERGEVVRTILAVNEADQSLTFAGEIPQGSMARLMRANFDRLVDGAQGAALRARGSMGQTGSRLALLISCVGRKLVLRERTEEELEAVRRVLGRDVVLTGFYSYGEICPAAPDASCELHNQTMTITAFEEE